MQFIFVWSLMMYFRNNFQYDALITIGQLLTVIYTFSWNSHLLSLEALETMYKAHFTPDRLN